MKNILFLVTLIVSPVFAHFLSITSAYADAIYDPATIVVGATHGLCIEDASCINRLHPSIPMTHRVKPGQTILFHTRDAVDVLGTIAAQRGDTEESEVLRAGILDKSRFYDIDNNFAHPMAGPVYIEGAEPGDVLKVTIIRDRKSVV